MSKQDISLISKLKLGQIFELDMKERSFVIVGQVPNRNDVTYLDENEIDDCIEKMNDAELEENFPRFYGKTANQRRPKLGVWIRGGKHELSDLRFYEVDRSPSTKRLCTVNDVSMDELLEKDVGKTVITRRDSHTTLFQRAHE